MNSWQNTIIVCVLVAGAVTAGVFKLEALAGTLAGAAAGVVAPTGGSSSIRAVAPVALALIGGGAAFALTHGGI